LTKLSRPGWAWEWLRRIGEYREHSSQVGLPQKQLFRGNDRVVIVKPQRKSCPSKWGLHVIEDADQPYGKAAIFWRSELHPSILTVTARTAKSSQNLFTVDVSQLHATTTVLKAEDGREHVLFSDGINCIQIEVLDGTILQGPVHLALQLNNLEPMRNDKLIAIKRLTALAVHKRFPSLLFAPEPDAARWLLWLEVRERFALGNGPTQIAQDLYGPQCSTGNRRTAHSRWAISRVCRALKNANRMLSGGYLQILNAPDVSAASILMPPAATDTQ
jgi:hypothetical protein